MEAYYYLGSVYRDLHNSPQAVDSYLKALKIAQAAHDGDVDTIVMANICAQLGDVFFRQRNYKQTQAYAEKGVYLCQAIGKNDVRRLMDIASCLFHQDKLDSAFAYHRKVLNMLQVLGGWAGNLDILAEQFSNYAQVGRMAEADSLHDMLDHLVREHGSVPSNYYTAKAIYFQRKNMPDSAICYYETVYRRAGNVEDRNYAALRLLGLYGLVGNEPKVLEYARTCAAMQDSVRENIALQQTADVYNEYRYSRDKEAGAESHSCSRRSYGVRAYSSPSVP